MHLKDLSILAKIAIPASILGLVSILIVAYASISVDRLAVTVALQDRIAARLKFALEAQSAFNSVAVSEKNVILTGAEATVAKGHIALYDKAVEATLAALDQLSPVADTPEQRSLIETMADNVRHRREVSQSVFALSAQDKITDAFALSSKEAAKYRKAASEAVDTLVKLNDGDLQAIGLRAKKSSVRTRFLLWGGSAFGLIAAFLVTGWIVITQIVRPVRGITRQMESLASGDLTGEVGGTGRGDEVGALARSLQIFKRNAVERRGAAADAAKHQATVDVLDRT